ncbi:MAG: hypothetical protein ACD_71C00179G0007 [uncultured bacterium (gcode 4)]|uniref:Uracil-DNA glycosylase-like domain-containing protein n=1 Tax=uncultured bacterium (gcode 4) TaxID=1234023 RepID=K1Z447_9BACT|nr:MAG: hypothetical protein ACD_71C00179G0007 [uncultured bacterium (gcode 4)]
MDKESLYKNAIKAGRTLKNLENLRIEMTNWWIKDVPKYDPSDGWENAEFLFLLEAPGRMSANRNGSWFISRDNNDPTAKNCSTFHQETWIPREKTLNWNIVPWYIGSIDQKKIRHPAKIDIEEGYWFLIRLIELLPKLKAIVLQWKSAQKIQKRLEDYFLTNKKNILILICPHPSNQSINRYPQNRKHIMRTFLDVKKLIEW